MPQQWKSLETDEEFRNEIIKKKIPQKIISWNVNFLRFLSFRPIRGLHFNELLI